MASLLFAFSYLDFSIYLYLRKVPVDSTAVPEYNNLEGILYWKRLLLNIVLIGLSKELPEQDENYELHRLLGALLSEQLSTDEKLSIIEKEYHIPLEENIRRDVGIMCNLSQGIREEAREEARKEIKEEIIMNMHNTGFSIEQIALATQKEEKEVEAIIKEREPVLA